MNLKCSLVCLEMLVVIKKKKIKKISRREIHKGLYEILTKCSRKTNKKRNSFFFYVHLVLSPVSLGGLVVTFLLLLFCYKIYKKSRSVSRLWGLVLS